MTVQLLPSGDVFDGNLVIGVTAAFLRYIQHHQRPDEPLGRNLVHCPTRGGEMGGRVNVGSKMLGHGNSARKIAIAFQITQLVCLKR